MISYFILYSIIRKIYTINTYPLAFHLTNKYEIFRKKTDFHEEKSHNEKRTSFSGISKIFEIIGIHNNFSV